MSSLTIRIPEKLRKELDKLSRDKQQPVSDLVRDSLRKYVALERFRELRKKTMPLAEARGFVTDEDVMKAIREDRVRYERAAGSLCHARAV